MVIAGELISIERQPGKYEYECCHCAADNQKYDEILDRHDYSSRQV